MSGRALSRADIAALTDARLTVSGHGQAMSTSRTLEFALDHARAREAVMSELDIAAVSRALAASGLRCQTVTSAAGTRATYIRRPDLGRSLPPEAATDLTSETPVDVALVLGDGLSAVAVALNGAAFVTALAAALAAEGLSTGPVILARQARVALGDAIARAQGARCVVMALGERPGLSAADSLGVYITHAPGAATPDSARNCISNIRAAGLSIDEAVAQTLSLIRAMRQSGLSGVALNQALASGALAPG